MLFFQFHARITTFLSKKCWVWLLSKKLTSKCLAQNDIKNDVKIDIFMSRRKYPERVKIAENLVGYAKIVASCLSGRAEKLNSVSSLCAHGKLSTARKLIKNVTLQILNFTPVS